MSSSPSPLDDIDRAILSLLNDDARHTTAVEIGESIGVSDSTVRNRLEQLEDRGIIIQYTPIVDFTKVGYNYVVDITATVSSAQREEKAQEVLTITGVIGVFEIMSGKGNLNIHVAAKTLDDISDLISEIDEIVGEIEDENIIHNYHFQPTTHFGEDIDRRELVDESDNTTEDGDQADEASDDQADSSDDSL